MRALIFLHLVRITSLCGLKWSHAFNFVGFKQLGLAVGHPTFANLPPKIHQKLSQKVRDQKIFGRGACPQTPPLAGALHALLIAYWNPPFQNSRSATGSATFSCKHDL